MKPLTQPTETARNRHQSGIVLLLVLFFILLLTSGIASFMRYATVDYAIANNRDAAAQAEALARGGVRLAHALLVEDRLLEEEEGDGEAQFETDQDPWALAGDVELPAPEGTQLALRIEDVGNKLNINALFDEEGAALDDTELYLTAVLEKVIDEMEIPPAERELLDPGDLAVNLIDWIDTDEERHGSGTDENDYYQLQDPPYKVSNAPLQSLDELGRIEGFDHNLVQALRPYLSVHPPYGGGGINPNTADSWVLSLIYHGTGGEFELADEDTVREVVEAREELAEENQIFCKDSEGERCVSIGDYFDTIFPEPSFSTNYFLVASRASVGDIARTVETVIDRTSPSEPRFFYWRVY